MRRTLFKLAVSGAALSLLATGCLGGGGGDGGGGGGGGGGGDGKVEILGAFPGQEADAFNESLKPFEEKSGIDVQYTATGDFDTLIRTRVQGQDPPDIALHPQPGVLLDLARSGKVVALDDALDLAKLRETLIPGFLEAATGEDGKVYGAPMRMALKDLIWYPVPEFEEAGYKAATTQAELVQLADQMKSDGKTPWCLGMESAQATGWVATDWIEEYVLRIGGPEKYDAWVKHEIPFNDPVVKQAAQEFEKIAFPQGNVLGGRQGIVRTTFSEAANPLFEDPPACLMHRQGNFITGFFPDAVQTDLAANVGIFVLPPVEGGFDGTALVGGGDIAALYSKDDDEAKQVMEFITSPEFGGAWAKAGGWLSPHKTFDASQYPDEVTREMAKIASEADVFRFDGSDLMPGAVGAGTFWTGMVDWISGEKELDAVLSDIEKSWPSS